MKKDVYAKNPLIQTITAFILLAFWLGSSGGISWLIVHRCPGAGPFLYFSAFAVAWGVCGVGIHRFLMAFFPLQEGPVLPGPRQEFIYHVLYLPFIFFLFYPLALSRTIPIPLTRFFFELFGA